MKKILVLYDFSTQSKKALRIAVQIAKKINGVVRLLHILNPPSFGEALLKPEKMESWEAIVRELEDRAREKLDKISSKYSSEVNVFGDVMIGSLLDEIICYQKERKFDLMVIGAKITSGLGSHFFGSLTDRIVHKSTIPVLVVKKETSRTSIKKIVFGNAYSVNEKDLSENIFVVKLLFEGAEIDLMRVNTPNNFMSEDVFDARVKKLKKMNLLKDCAFHSINHNSQENGLIYYASKTKSDMIVIGDKHSSAIRRWIIGEDFAENVMDFSNIPVLIL